MVNKTKFLIFLLSLSFCFSTLAKTRFLSTEATELNGLVDTDIIGGSFDIAKDEDTYFFYKISEDTTVDYSYNVFTIFSPDYTTSLDVKCVLDTGTSLSDDIKKKLSSESTCKVFQAVNKTKIINVVFDISNYKKETSNKLWLKINSSTEKKIKIYIRKAKSYFTEFKEAKNLEISSPYAFKLVNPEYENTVKTQTYYDVPEANAIHVYGEHTNGTIYLIDISSLFIVSNQTLAAYLKKYSKIYLFFGSVSENSKKLSINYNTKDSNTPLYYYTNADDVLTTNEISFFSECQENDNFYLIVNYKSEDKDPYLFISNINGGSLYLNENNFDSSKYTGLNGDFTQITKSTKLTYSNNHLETFRLTCGTKGVVFSNLRFKNKEDPPEKMDISEGTFNEFFVSFKANSKKYFFPGYVSKFKLLITIPSSKETKKFTIDFEGNVFELSSDQTIYLEQVLEFASFSITSSESIDAVVTVNSFTNLPGGSPLMQVGNLFLYELTQEFNADYGIEITLQNSVSKNGRKICYYVSEVTTLEPLNQNCKYVTGSAVFNFTKLLFKKSDEESKLNTTYSYNKYYVFLFDIDGDKISFWTTKVLTSLEKSKKINTLENSLLTYEQILEKDTYYYFSHDFSNGQGIGSSEGHLDLYLLNNTYDDVNIDIQCILVAEVALEYDKNYFNPENYTCRVLNKDEKNTTVKHVVFDQEKYLKNPSLETMIRLKADKQVSVKFLLRKDFNNNVLNTLNLYKTNTILLSSLQTSTIYTYNTTYLKDLKLSSVVFYFYYPDSIKIVGKANNGSHIMLDKGSIMAISYNEYSFKYSDFEKFYIIVGKFNINAESLTSDYFVASQTTYVSYFHADSFVDGYSIQIKNDDCSPNNQKYLIYNYGKQYLKSDIYLVKKVNGGDLVSAVISDKFKGASYASLPDSYDAKDLQQINDNEQHANLIKYKCNSDFMVTFTYFVKVDYDPKDVIKLEQGVAKQYFLSISSKYTFSYDKINEMKIDYIYGEDNQEILFEDQQYTFENNMSLLYRTKDSTNKFTVENKGKKRNLVLQISSSIDINTYEKTNIDNLYKNGNTYVYKAPKKIKYIKLNLSKNQKRLRLLDDSSSPVKVCYTADEMLLKEQSGGSCFYMSDNDYNFEYKVPSNFTKNPFYLVVYPEKSSDKIFVQEAESKDKVPDSDGDGDDSDDNSGMAGWAVFLIVLAVLIVLLVVAFMIIMMIRKKNRITSEDIDTSIKEPAEIVN